MGKSLLVLSQIDVYPFIFDVKNARILNRIVINRPLKLSSAVFLEVK